jgi:hypothetical protein
MEMTPISVESILPLYREGFPGHDEYFCNFRDAFSARLDSYIRKSERYLEGAILGEIGNNTFDHNFNFTESFPRGIYFDHDAADFIVLADYGSGIRETLSRVVPTLSSDVDAVETAFTKVISGRAPEQRGNGLKFVLSGMVDNQWTMYFHSGHATCRVADGVVRYESSSSFVSGCLAILGFGNERLERKK